MATDDNINRQLKALQSLDAPKASNASSIAALSSAMGKASRGSLGEAASGEVTQQLGAAAGVKAAKNILGTDTQAATNRQQQGQLALGQQGAAQGKTVADRELEMQKTQADHTNRLSKLSMKLSQQLHEDTTQFKRDDLGRTVFNEKQLMDYAVTQAKSAEELANFQQQMQQMSDRKVQIMKQAYAVIDAAMRNQAKMEMQNAGHQFSMEQQKKNQQVKMDLAAAKVEADRKVQAAKQKAAQTAGFMGIASAAVGVLSVAYPPVGIFAAGALAVYAANQ